MAVEFKTQELIHETKAMIRVYLFLRAGKRPKGCREVYTKELRKLLEILRKQWFMVKYC
jgi:hypothetical protein